MDTKENYIKKMGKHTKNDETINMKEVRKIEKEMNAHAENLVNILNAGSNNNQTKRIKGNLKTVDNQIPVLSGTSKDHKKSVDQNLSPDVRPIMGAMVGPNVGISKFGSLIVRAVADEFDVGNVGSS